jgi:thioesterase domain-containing protein
LLRQTVLDSAGGGVAVDAGVKQRLRRDGRGAARLTGGDAIPKWLHKNRAARLKRPGWLKQK